MEKNRKINNQGGGGGDDHLGLKSKPELLEYHFKGLMCIDQKVLFKTKEKPATQLNLPLEVTFNKIIPIITNVNQKYWHILSIHEKNLHGRESCA